MIALPISGKEAVGRIIPHKGRMLLLDGVMDFDPEGHGLSSTMTVRRDNLFWREGEGLPGYVCFELMAQTISAYEYLSASHAGAKPKLGFILGVDHFHVAVPLVPEGAQVRTTVRLGIQLAGGMYQFDGVATAEGRKVAEGSLLVFDVEDPDRYLGGRHG